MSSTMRRRLWVPVWVASSAASLVLAGSARHEGPQQFINPALDGIPVLVESPVDGRALAAWTYRAGRELDIAVSSRDNAGTWSRPVFIGSFDGIDQRSPALALDGGGNAYLAFSASDSKRVFVSLRPAGLSTWSAPRPVSPEGVAAGAPALLVVGDQLIIGFRASGRTTLVKLPLSNIANRPDSINDGPDPIGREDPPPPPPEGEGSSGGDGVRPPEKK